MLEIIIYIIAAGIAGYEVCYSELATRIKRILFLDKHYPVLQLLLSLKAYKKVLGLKLTSLLLFPVIIPIMIILFAHRIIFQLFNCPFCLGFHISFWSGLILLSLTVPMATATAFISMGVTAIYNLIRLKSF
jgi:hypothetical protein